MHKSLEFAPASRLAPGRGCGVGVNSDALTSRRNASDLIVRWICLKVCGLFASAAFVIAKSCGSFDSLKNQNESLLSAALGLEYVYNKNKQILIEKLAAYMLYIALIFARILLFAVIMRPLQSVALFVINKIRNLNLNLKRHSLDGRMPTKPTSHVLTFLDIPSTFGVV